MFALMLTGGVLWCGAGVVGLSVCIQNAETADKTTMLLFCLKGGLPWSMFGALWVAWYALVVKSLAWKLRRTPAADMLQLFNNSFTTLTGVAVPIVLVPKQACYGALWTGAG